MMENQYTLGYHGNVNLFFLYNNFYYNSSNGYVKDHIKLGRDAINQDHEE